MQFHKLELNRETEPPFVGHAWQQCGLVKGERPQVLSVWIVPRMRHGKSLLRVELGIL